MAEHGADNNRYRRAIAVRKELIPRVKKLLFDLTNDDVHAMDVLKQVQYIDEKLTEAITQDLHYLYGGRLQLKRRE